MAGVLQAIRHYQPGIPTDMATTMGCIVSQQQHEKIMAYIALGQAEGATLAYGGQRPSDPALAKGWFVQPTVFTNVTQKMRLANEEIFGPVLGIVRVQTLQEAMDLIDAHEYGNGTCIFTRDGEAARYFSDNILVGMVGVNVPLPVPVAYHSFGGWKRSLFGDLHAYGPDAVRFYTKRKTITQRWPSAGVREGTVFSFPSNR